MAISQLSDIRLNEEDLPDAVLASSQRIYSPTAPTPPAAELGWRDRWWLDGKPARCVSIHYWIFSEPEQAREAADKGRIRLSARQIVVDGKLDSIYQKLRAAPCGEVCWQAFHNILFVRDNVAILVAESGRQVPLGTMLDIATRIDAKILEKQS